MLLEILMYLGLALGFGFVLFFMASVIAINNAYDEQRKEDEK